MKPITTALLITSLAMGLGISSNSAASAMGFSGVSCTATSQTSYKSSAAAECSGSHEGNFNPQDAVNFLNGAGPTSLSNPISGPIFGNISNWQFDKKINTPGTAENGTNILGFSITPTTGSTSGTWGFTDTRLLNIVLELKGANFLSFYYWEGISGESTLEGLWDTLGVAQRTQKDDTINSPDLSHASLFFSQGTPTGGPITAVPEPSSILGSIAFLGIGGFLCYRRKQTNKTKVA